MNLNKIEVIHNNTVNIMQNVEKWNNQVIHEMKIILISEIEGVRIFRKK